MIHLFQDLYPLADQKFIFCLNKSITFSKYRKLFTTTDESKVTCTLCLAALHELDNYKGHLHETP